MDLELLVDVLQVKRHGVHADPERFGRRLLVMAVDEELQELELLLGEVIVRMHRRLELAKQPQHPACDNAGALIEDLQDGDSSMTVFFNGCPGADVTVERVVQLTSNRLLWVQVRSEDRATANRVLASVTTTGI